MKRIKVVWLLTVLILLFPSVNAQVVFETKIDVGNTTVVEKSTERNHFIRVTKGDWVDIFHTLYNYFDADFVEIDVTYSVVNGENLISEISTSGLHTYWTQKGEWNNFEFHFKAEAIGKVWMVFNYNGTYWEHFPISQPRTFSSLMSFSSLTFEIVEVGLPYIPILLVVIGVAVVVVSSISLFYKKEKNSKKLNTNT